MMTPVCPDPVRKLTRDGPSQRSLAQDVSALKMASFTVELLAFEKQGKEPARGPRCAERETNQC